MAKKSVHDRIDILDTNLQDDDNNDYTTELANINNEINEIDNEVIAIKDDLEEFMENWKQKSFEEVEEFLQDTLSEVVIKLGLISERLY